MSLKGLYLSKFDIMEILYLLLLGLTCYLAVSCTDVWQCSVVVFWKVIMLWCDIMITVIVLKSCY